MSGLAEYEQFLAKLSPADKSQVDKLLAKELAQVFLPNPGPQTDALFSEADILLYGGAAGGGKTGLLVGCAALDHADGLIVRRQGTQLEGLIKFSRELLSKSATFVAGNVNTWTMPGGRTLRFAGLNEPDDWRKYAGIGRDFYGFDEAGEFLKEQVFSLIAWLRTTRKGQRCRVILASNPPRGGEGEWLITEFAPWLDPMFPNPAKNGELRWAVVVAGDTKWVGGPGEFTIEGETYTAQSRTFIPALLDDNPYLSETNYRATLQNLPEPLRTQLLKGDFLAGREDHEWQVIPTEWVRLANERWDCAEKRTRQMLALAMDVAMGGGASTVISRLHSDAWFAPLIEVKGVDMRDPIEHATLMIKHRRNQCDLSVDLTGGWGTGVKSHLENGHSVLCAGITFGEGSGGLSPEGWKYKNVRAEMYWEFRHALNPESGNDIKLPPDRRLTAELTTPRYDSRKIPTLQVEAKEDIEKRVGGSVDRADAVVMAWHRRQFAAMVQRQRQPPGGWLDVAPQESVLRW